MKQRVLSTPAWRTIAFASLIALALAGCGGGGGSGGGGSSGGSSANASPDTPDGTEVPDGEVPVSTATPNTNSSYTVGQSYYYNNPENANEVWLQYIPGDLPIVISAPHGGTTKPASVTTRTSTLCTSGFETAIDTATDNLAREIRNAFSRRYGGKTPHIIVAEIARNKVDLNRNKTQAACGNATMEATWTQYHKFIADAANQATTTFGKALYIDLHGHALKKERFVLGYGYGATTLRNFANDPSYTSSSFFSLKNLPAYQNRNTTGTTARELLMGNTAFGTYFKTTADSWGAWQTITTPTRYPAPVPSLGDPAPAVGDGYFEGGYNTSLYTGSKYPNVFGWQIETNGDSRTSTNDEKGKCKRIMTGEITADAIIKFLKQHHPEFRDSSDVLKWKVPEPSNAPLTYTSTASC